MIKKMIIGLSALMMVASFSACSQDTTETVEITTIESETETTATTTETETETEPETEAPNKTIGKQTDSETELKIEITNLTDKNITSFKVTNDYTEEEIDELNNLIDEKEPFKIKEVRDFYYDPAEDIADAVYQITFTTENDTEYTLHKVPVLIAKTMEIYIKDDVAYIEYTTEDGTNESTYDAEVEFAAESVAEDTSSDDSDYLQDYSNNQNAGQSNTSNNYSNSNNSADEGCIGDEGLYVDDDADADDGCIGDEGLYVDDDSTTDNSSNDANDPVVDGDVDDGCIGDEGLFY